MRLINTATLKIHEFLNDNDIPDFAILSHTWGPEECTLQQMNDPNVTARAGFTKIKLSCKQALRDKLQWVWVDTCCIDKSSTAELSEAINSMFRWYRQSKICYVFLSDVSDTSRFTESRWFTRGWTLQELVAPLNVCFYDMNWDWIGTKMSLQTEISKRTRIAEGILETGQFDHISIAHRFSWAADRETTRTEDLAYCLLGIFDVNMPLLYGEGSKAFRRLQEEIMKISDDQSLFAWGLSDKPRTIKEFLKANRYDDFELLPRYGLFARAPSDFTYAHRIRALKIPHASVPPIVSNSGVRIELQLLQLREAPSFEFAAIFCSVEGNYSSYLGFPLRSDGHHWKARLHDLVLIHVNDLIKPGAEAPYRDPSVCLIRQPSFPFMESVIKRDMKILLPEDEFGKVYELEDVACSPNTTYSTLDQTIKLPVELDGLHAVIFFAPSRAKDVALSFINNRVTRRALERETILDRVYYQSIFQMNRAGRSIFTSIQPTFAILVGGKQSYPWVKCVLVHDDNEPTTNLNSLVKTSDEYVLSTDIASRNHLKTVLQGYADDSMFSENFDSVEHTIASWQYNNRSDEALSGKGHIFVHANIETSRRNLVESAHFLKVRIARKLPFEFDIITDNWWASA